MKATNRKLAVGLVILLALAFTAFGAQEKAPDAKPSAPELKQESVIAILKLQRQQLAIENDAKAALEVIRRKQAEGNAVQARLAAAIEQAFKDAGVDEKKFTLNVVDLKFEPRKPEEKPKQ